MKTLNYTGLNESKKVTDGLQQLLADLQVYYTNLRGFHWHIKGKDFYVLHKAFESMYNSVSDKVDEVAERLLMLDMAPQNSFSNYLKSAKIKELEFVSDGIVALKNVLDTSKYLMSLERGILSAASEAGDEVTVALMSDYLKEQEKEVWMLVAYHS